MLSGNTASKGGGIYVEYSSLRFANVTVASNTATTGGGIYNYSGSQLAASNSILWHNTPALSPQIYSDASSSFAIRYSLIEGGAPDGNSVGIINADPIFVRNPSAGSDRKWGTADDDYGDLHLRSGSPAIDAGENSSVPTGVSGDRDDHIRFADDPQTVDTGSGSAPIVDLGGYEYASPSLPTVTSTATATVTPTASSTPTINTFRREAFILLGEGATPGFQTTSCARIAPDDELIESGLSSFNYIDHIVSFGYFPPNSSLPNGHYRLLICETVTGTYPLLDGDGDGIAGGDFIRNFSVDRPLPTTTPIEPMPSTIDATPSVTPTHVATPTKDADPSVSVTATPELEPPTSTPYMPLRTPTGAIGTTPQLQMDNTIGQPGSVFVLNGSNYHSNTRAVVYVNGISVGTVAIGSSGTYVVRLVTDSASATGTYEVTVTTPEIDSTSMLSQAAHITYTLRQDAPLHESDSKRVDAELVVQTDILPAAASRVYLPRVQRSNGN